MDTNSHCKICGNREFRPVLTEIRDWEYGFPSEFSYRQCQQCGQIQIHPFPSIEDLVCAYQVDYHGFAPPSSKGVTYSMLFRLVEKLTFIRITKMLAKDAKILDIGCGIGLCLSKLKMAGITNLKGIDFSTEAVEAVRTMGIECHQGIFETFKDDPKSYDGIFMNNYLEHTLDPLKELEKARYLLKPNGKLIGELPNFAAVDRHIFGRYWGGNHVPRHTFQFTPETLKTLLKHAGFSEVDISHPVNTSHFALSIQNFLQRTNDNLANNPRLKHGRAWYYSILMVALVVPNLFAAALGRGGFIRFVSTP